MMAYRNTISTSDSEDTLANILYEQVLEQSDVCDVIIEIEGQEIRYHWCVLLRSPMLHALYHSNLEERKTGKIKIQQGSPAALKTVLSFLYRQRVSLTIDNVWGIFETADYLMMEELKEECTKFILGIENNLDNCLEIVKKANSLGIDVDDTFIRAHIPQVIQQDAAQNLSKDYLQVLLTDETLSYVPAEDWFLFLERWMKQDQPSRKTGFVELFLHLNLRGISNAFVQSVILNNEIVLGDENCLKHAKQCNMYSTGSKDVILNPCLSEGRLWSGYVIDEDRWIMLNLPKEFRNAFSVFSTGHTMYAQPTSTYLRRLSEFNLLNNEIITKEVKFKTDSDEMVDVSFAVACCGKLYCVAAMTRMIKGKLTRELMSSFSDLDFSPAELQNLLGQYENILADEKNYSMLFVQDVECEEKTHFEFISLCSFQSEVSSICAFADTYLGILLNGNDSTILIFDPNECQMLTLALPEVIARSGLKEHYLLKPLSQSIVAIHVRDEYRTCPMFSFSIQKTAGNKRHIVCTKIDLPPLPQKTMFSHKVMQQVCVPYSNKWLGYVNVIDMPMLIWYPYLESSSPKDNPISADSDDNNVLNEGSNLFLLEQTDDATSVWRPFSAPKTFITSVAMHWSHCVVKVPADKMRCHIECPHCRYLQQREKRSRAYPSIYIGGCYSDVSDSSDVDYDSNGYSYSS